MSMVKVNSIYKMLSEPAIVSCHPNFALCNLFFDALLDRRLQQLESNLGSEFWSGHSILCDGNESLKGNLKKI